MEIIFTPSNITFILGLLAIIFSVYHYFRNPQVKLEKGESLMAMSISQLQKDLANLRDNHVHTLDLKLDEQSKNIRDIMIQITKLQTIIEERMPSKKL